MINKHLTLVFVCSLFLAQIAPVQAASDKEELLKLHHTTINLIELLVEQGVLPKEKADALIAEARLKAEKEVASMSVEDKTASQFPNAVRVPYIPEHIKDQIRAEVRADLRNDVSNDVMAKAQQERWGVPGATPEWVDRIKWFGDIRVRYQGDNYASGNAPNTYFDFLDANDDAALFTGYPINTTENRHRLRARLRLGMKAKVTEGVNVGVRLATGNFAEPVSTNETFGNYGDKYRVALDQAYIEYKSVSNFVNAWAGRMKNPFYSTDLVWDGDLGFDGIAMRLNLLATNDLEIEESNIDPFIVLGAFPIQEEELTENDKWLFGGQVGFEYSFLNQNKFKFGLAYYNYQNIRGKLNTPFSQLDDYTAPDYLQKGNTLFDIRNDGNATHRYALASDYDLLNITASYDIANFAPVHVILSGDYVKNIGYDLDSDAETQLRALLGGQLPNEQTTGWQARLTVGWPDVTQRRNWQLYTAYRYLERDAVLDAFTDSDFHLGGTDAEGWILGGKYGLYENTWLNVRYMSSDEIDGPPLGIDTLQVDLNAKF